MSIVDRKNNIKRLLLAQNNPNLAILTELESLNKNILDLSEELKKKDYELELSGEEFKGDKGDTGDVGEGGGVGEQGFQGERGEKGDAGNQGEKGEDGKDGKTGQQGSRGVKGDLGEQGMQGLQGDKGDIGDMPKHEYKNGLLRFELPNNKWGKWISLIDLIDKAKQSFGGQTLHRGGLDFVRDRFTHLTNGVTKTFTLSAVPKVDTVEVKSSQFPFAYDPDVDFTVSGTILTLTSKVGAPQTGQTLIVTYVKS